MRRFLVAMVVVGFLGGPAVGEPDDKPWAKNVSTDDQTRALALYREGNAEFTESRYSQALAKYREALRYWDHPGIRFNMAVSLINLDQPLEAYEHIEAALRYGEAPLGADTHAQGLTYKKLLLGQLARLKVSCRQAGVEITLDGKPLLSGSGEADRLLLPGSHQLVASKSGFATETAALVLLSGKELVRPVELHVAEANVRLIRRWKPRTPWIVVGAGAGTAALGAIGLVLARQEFSTFDQLVRAQCPMGCSPEMPAGMQEVAASTTAHKTRGRIENVVGVSLLATGGAAAVAGLVGVYLNVPRRVAEKAPVIAPAIGSRGAGATLRWSF